MNPVGRTYVGCDHVGHALPAREHRVGQPGAEHRADLVRCHVRHPARSGQLAGHDHDAHGRVEMRASDRAEHLDQDVQAADGSQGVGQQRRRCSRPKGARPPELITTASSSAVPRLQEDPRMNRGVGAGQENSKFGVEHARKFEL